MKRWFSLLSILLALWVLAACDLNGQETRPVITPHYVSFTSAGELQEYLSWSPRRIPFIGAHRGAPMPGYPENCLATFENALTYAPCLIECDISKTKDGVLVMFHDDRLERTSTGKGKVSDTTWSQLQMLWLKDGDKKSTPYKVPTLADTLGWARGKAVLQLDVKKGIEPEEIAQMIRHYNAESYALVITYSLEMAKRYHKLNPQLMISTSAEGLEACKRLLASGIPAKNLIAFVGVYEPPQEVYTMLHEKNIRAILGTMGNLDRKADKDGLGVYTELYKNGADVLATDNTPQVAKAIREIARQKEEAAGQKK
jgi:glycerophosphoryl diester phosphodiesterase